jgi:hypothetical protein
MILIYPPVAKPSEPSAGLAQLSGLLRRHGVAHKILDANLEGFSSLVRTPISCSDRWTTRAFRKLSENLASLRNRDIYYHLDRYKRAVSDVNRLLEVAARERGVTVGLANYQERDLSPLRSHDLIQAAERPERNPFYPYFKKRLEDLLDKEEPAHVGFSLNYLSQALCTFSMIGFIRQLRPDLKLIIGGGLVTSWMRNPGWRNPFRGWVDHLIAGPGEVPLLSILGIHRAERQSAPDFTHFPCRDYLAPGFILPYSASSGCYWKRCSFCPETAEGGSYTSAPTKEVLSDLKRLVAEMRPEMIHLLDNSISPALLEGLAEGPPGAPWYGFARINSQLTDSNFCRALRRSGCVMLQLGVESGDQDVLDRMEKGILLSTASSALKALKNAGIATYVYLLFGAPPETLTEARKTLSFTVEHSEEIDFLNLAVFNLPVGGVNTGELETHDFYEGDLSLYRGFVHPRGWDRKKVRLFLNNEFKKDPAIAPIVAKDPPIFTSNHAPFFLKD